MENEKKYKELVGKIKKAYLYAQTDSTKAVLEDILPELKESDDERIRKELIRYFKEMNFVAQEGAEKVTRWIAWLEKQEEKSQGKSALEAIKEKADNANKVEPKDYSSIDPLFFKTTDVEKETDFKLELDFDFSVGQWIVACGKKVFRITKIDGFNVTLVDTNGDEYVFDVSSLKDARLWTIKDAKDGDVLVSDNIVFIFNKIHDIWIKCHCSLYEDNSFYGGDFDLMHIKYGKEVFPATKEQCDKLFKAMADAGYEWDAEKKEPKKIDQTPAWSKEDEKNLKRAIWYVEHSAINVVKDTMLSEWLKSIKDRVQPQKQWKPSEEQIDALEHFVRSIGESGHASPYDANLKLVHSLFNDLKKLKS